MKRALLALLLLGGLALPVIAARPQPAAANPLADLFCPIFGLCEPFAATASCPIFQVGVSVPQPGRHVYQYEEECTGGGLPGRFTVRASYDVAGQEAQERLTAVSGAWTITSAWSCPTDPWIRGDVPGCRNTFGQIDARGEGAPIYYDWARQPKPLSVLLLEDRFYPVLDGQLQNALNRPAPAAATTPAPAPAAPAALAWPALAPGASGEAVRTVQYLLRHHGADVDVDGDFGEQTGAAVSRFRHNRGLQVTALRGSNANQVVTPESWAALIVEVGPGSQGDAVAAVQSQLASRGMVVAVDGDFGEQTAAAVAQYRHDRGLSVPSLRGSNVNQIVTRETWAALVSGK
jgi:peptidoglycan hydrolase-like protein with peptidoglycan-binding domain